MVTVTTDEPDEQQPTDDDPGEQQDDAVGGDRKPGGGNFAPPLLGGILARQQELADLFNRSSAVYSNLAPFQSLFEAADRYQRIADSFEKYFSPHLLQLQKIPASFLPLVKIPLPNWNIPPDWYPPNWEEIPGNDVDDLGDKAIAIIQGEGIPMVWVPRPDIVASLVHAADADARDAILLSSRDDIAADCLGALSVVTNADLKPLADLGADAVSAQRAGHESSAQALATNVFDTVLRDAIRRGVIFDGPLGYFRYDKVLKRIEPVSGETPHQEVSGSLRPRRSGAGAAGFRPGRPRACPVRQARHRAPRRTGAVHAG